MSKNAKSRAWKIRHVPANFIARDVSAPKLGKYQILEETETEICLLISMNYFKGKKYKWLPSWQDKNMAKIHAEIASINLHSVDEIENLIANITQIMSNKLAEEARKIIESITSNPCSCGNCPE